MRDLLPEWYLPDDGGIRRLITEATIALDANVLLDLYRVSTTQREQILDVLSRGGVCERVWIPYQAAWEYQRNRLKVAQEHENHYSAVKSRIADLPKTFTSALDNLRDKDVRSLLEEKIGVAVAEAQKVLYAELDALQKINVIPAQTIRAVDPIRSRIDGLLTGKDQVGPKPAAEVIKEREDQMSERYDNEVPPGYLDAKKQHNASGDLQLWFEVLARATRLPDQSILLITGDVKDDWYLRSGGKVLGPRTELVAEYASYSTSGTYHQMTLDSFLHHANLHLGTEVGVETIAAIERIAEARLSEYELAKLKSKFPDAEEILISALQLNHPNPVRVRGMRDALRMLAGEAPYQSAEFRRAYRYARDYIDSHDTTYDAYSRINGFRSQPVSADDVIKLYRRALSASSRPELTQLKREMSVVDDYKLIGAVQELANLHPEAHKELARAVAELRTQDIAREIAGRSENAASRDTSPEY